MPAVVICINKKEMRFVYMLLFLFSLQHSAKSQSREALLKIDSLRHKMQQLARENKLYDIGGFYTNNAIVAGTDAVLSGKEEIEKYWQGIRGAGEDWYWEIQCVSGSDATIYQTGISYLTLKYGDVSKTYAVNFCVAWERQDDGSYKISADIYH